MDTFTTLSALLPSPTSTIVAIIDGEYLFVDCDQRPHFADWVITPAYKLQRYTGHGPVLGVVVWVLANPQRVLPLSPDAVAQPSSHWDHDTP